VTDKIIWFFIGAMLAVLTLLVQLYANMNVRDNAQDARILQLEERLPRK
jgi:hypothetical protein